MSPPVRVLIVDDSVVVRRIVQRALETEPGIEVVGTAADGRIGVEKVRQLDPDVVTLDIEMPVMDGLAALAAIRKTHPRLPVIMFSTLTQRGASATLDALSLGASDYVTKPTQLGGMDDAVEHLRTELLPRIQALAGRSPEPAPAPPPPAGPTATARLSTSTPAAPVTPTPPVRPRVTAPSAAPPPRTAPPVGLPGVVAVGVSTGGPNALNDVIPVLPADLPVPVLVVQHMPPLFTRILAERLDGRSAVHVHEAAEGDVLSAGGVWIAPGGHHMVVHRDGRQVRVAINDEPPENSCRPAVDPLFRSVTAAYDGRVLGVILTGMGQDGLRGSETLRQAGGRVIAQDEATSVVWGMPGFVVRNGLADAVLPLTEIAPEIIRLVSGRGAVAPAGTTRPTRGTR